MMSVQVATDGNMLHFRYMCCSVTLGGCVYNVTVIAEVLFCVDLYFHSVTVLTEYYGKVLELCFLWCAECKCIVGFLSDFM